MRIKLWQIMAAVLMVAVALVCGMTQKRWARISEAYRLRAMTYEALSAFEDVDATHAPDAREEEKHHRRSFYYGFLGQKYRKAANCPWLPVSTDPPEP